MNTAQELQDLYNINIETAERMLEEYKARIGTLNGVQRIADITYIGDSTKDVKLVCKLCGKVEHREMKSGRNKWSELLRTCPCQKQIKERIKEQDKRQKELEKETALQNEIGNIYGDYEVIGYKRQEGKPDNLIIKCTACGEENIMSYSQRGERRCTKHYVQPVKFNESYVGKKNNMLVVVGITWGEDNKRRFVCRCDCGDITIVKPTFWEDGRVVSCGCYLENRSKDMDETARIKGIYRGMKARCYNPNSKSYRAYGARGITICDEWLNNEQAFIEWSFNNGYSNELTIDRKDNDKGYSPDNCRWTTWDIQCSHHRPRRSKEYYENGKTNKRPQDREVNLTGQ